MMKTNLSEDKELISKDDKIIEYKKRMLAWANPVEFVNNMYGSHPDDDDDDGPDYFQKVFSE